MTTGASTPTSHAPSRRSRARSFLPLGLAAWLVLEIWLLTVVVDEAGGFTVFLLLLAGVVLGSVVIKRAGRRAFHALTEALQQAQRQQQSLDAERSLGGNGLTMLGGLLLMLPGLISDLAGLLLIFPPTRSLFSAYGERSLERRMREAPPGGLGDAFQQARIHRPDGKIVQGEVIRDEEPPAPRRNDGPRPPLER
jgi:UPF0716 protein FxsA